MSINVKKEIPTFGIPRENEERRDGGCGIVYDPATKLFAVGKQFQKTPPATISSLSPTSAPVVASVSHANQLDASSALTPIAASDAAEAPTSTPSSSDGALRLFSGGVSADEDITEGILREVREESGLHDFAEVELIGKAFTHYHNTLRKVNRVTLATCLLIILKSADVRPVELEEHETFSLVWASAEELLADMNARNGNKDNDHWIYFMEKPLARLKEKGFAV